MARERFPHSPKPTDRPTVPGYEILNVLGDGRNDDGFLDGPG